MTRTRAPAMPQAVYNAQITAGGLLVPESQVIAGLMLTGIYEDLARWQTAIRDDNDSDIQYASFSNLIKIIKSSSDRTVSIEDAKEEDLLLFLSWIQSNISLVLNQVINDPKLTQSKKLELEKKRNDINMEISLVELKAESAFDMCLCHDDYFGDFPCPCCEDFDSKVIRFGHVRRSTH